MKKEEIAEIRKIVKPKDSCITEISSTYVNMDKEIIFSSRNHYWNISEQSREIYGDIFAKALSGRLERNLISLDFPIEEEKEDGKQFRLYKAVRSESDDNLDEIIESIIEHYRPKSNYAILIAKGAYDVPTKAKDEYVLEDTDGVYRFMVCAICPMDLSKPGLCYKNQENSFVENTRNWMVQMPEAGFLFPTFRDRNANVHECLYYTNKITELHPELIEDVLGCQMVLNADEQREMFKEIVETSLERTDIEDIIELNRNLNIYTKEASEEGERAKLGKRELINFLSALGAKDIDMNDEDIQIMAENVADNKYSIVTAGNIQIKTNEDGVALLKQRVIDGRKYLLVPIEEMHMNGINIKS